jgi:D-amino-acid dehydrogenase
MPERWQNVVVAAGHGMLGMTEGPITGSLATDLVEGRSPAMDISALSPDRF